MQEIQCDLQVESSVDVDGDLSVPDPASEQARASLMQCSKCGMPGHKTVYVKNLKLYLCRACHATS